MTAVVHGPRTPVAAGRPTARLRLLVALVAAATVLCILAAPRAALGWGAGAFSPESEASLLALQGDARAAGGLPALVTDPALLEAARWRAKDMAERGYFSHDIAGTGRRVFWNLEHEFGYCFRLAGENIGTVTWRGATEADATRWVFDRFMASGGHRANIEGRAWDAVAAGAYRSTPDTIVWAVLFADRCDPPARPVSPLVGARAGW
jgi:uncharacterized protein YkwD